VFSRNKQELYIYLLNHQATLSEFNKNQNYPSRAFELTWQRSAIISHSLRSSPEPPRPRPSGHSFWNSGEAGAGQAAHAASSSPALAARPQARPFVQQQARRLMASDRGARQNRLLEQAAMNMKKLKWSKTTFINSLDCCDFSILKLNFG
jgi:hypothetical protein